MSRIWPDPRDTQPDASRWEAVAIGALVVLGFGYSLWKWLG